MRFLALILLATTCLPALEIQRLRVEYLENPLGLVQPHPRLSWELSSRTQGTLQTAYQILVSSDPDFAKPDLWDSGKIKSPQTAQISYQGNPLKSGQFAYWKVKVWDEKDQLHQSSPSHWSAGLLEESDWIGDWIGLKGETTTTGNFPPEATTIQAKEDQLTFEKTFTWDSLIQIADLSLVASHTCTVHLNERHIMIVHANKGQALDISGYLLKGSNHLKIQFYAPAQKPTLKAILTLPSKTLSPDKTWQGTPVQNSTLPNTWTRHNRHLPARYLRKAISHQKPIRQAVLHLATGGLHRVSVNGSRVSKDLLSPGFVDFDHQVPTVTLDITKWMWRPVNVIDIVLANGRYYAPRLHVPAPTKNYGVPVIRGQLVLTHPDGTQTTYGTSTDWSVSDQGPIRSNNTYDGITTDARREFPSWWFVSKSIEENDPDPIFRKLNRYQKFQPAQILPAPKGRSLPTHSEPIRVLRTLKPQSVTRTSPNTHLIDFGENFTGRYHTQLVSNAGDKLVFRHAQRLHPDNTLDQRNLRSALATDHYICQGSRDGETYEPTFITHGFRYLEVSGLEHPPRIEGRVIGHTLKSSATFHSSNPTLNQTFAACRRTTISTYLSVPLDCADRDERQGWQGDRAAECRSEMNLYDVAAIYHRWLREIRRSQRPDGNVSDVSPAFWEMCSGSAIWPSVQTMAPYLLYLKYGDRRILADQFDSSSTWVDFLLTRRDQSGLLPADTYGDWCVPSDDRSKIHTQNPDLVTNKVYMANAFLAQQLYLISEIAQILGKPHQKYLSAREPLIEKIRTRWWSDHQFANATQTTFALAHSFNLVPPTSQKNFLDQFLARITRDQKRIGTGNVGIQYIHTALDDLGQSDLALHLATQPEYPGYGYMLAQDSKTIWETWNGDTAEPTMNSANHIMMVGDFPTWCIERLAGIQPDIAAPGYQNIILKPTIPADLTFVKASHHSIRGPITSAWEKTEKGLTWSLKIPANTTGTLHLPQNFPELSHSEPPLKKSKDGTIEIPSGTFKLHLN